MAGERDPAGGRKAPFEVPQYPGRRWGWVLSGFWLLYLAYPVSVVLGGDLQTWQRAVGIVATVVFAAGYLVAIRYGFAQLGGARFRYLWTCPLGLFAIAVGMSAVVGTDGATYAIFALTTAIMIWRPRVSVPAVVAVAGWSAYLLPALLGRRPVVELVVVCVFVALLLFSIRHMQRQEATIRRAREDLARLAVDAERARFSRDLHDIVGHSLTAIIVKAELAGALAHRRPDAVGAEVSDIEGLAREALEDVRRTVAGYREVTLAGELASARAVLEAAGVSATLPQAVDEVPGELRELFGWVVREGVTNVVRHSRASHCSVRVTPSSVEVEDDGRGGDPGSGNGLGGLRERVEASGGVLSAGAVDGGGFRLAVTVPQRAPAGEDVRV